MLIQAALLPLFVEVALTFVLLFWMGGLNIAAVQSGEVRPQEVALREPNWPARNRQVQNAYLNQLELPILFYVLTAPSRSCCGMPIWSSFFSPGCSWRCAVCKFSSMSPTTMYAGAELCLCRARSCSR